VLKDEGLVRGRKRRRRASPSPTPLRESNAPNELWCIDFKGQFRLGNGKYCYPLTVTDQYSRFLLGCEALDDTRTGPAQQALELVFRTYGLPKAIRSDNGAPFASTSHQGLSRLSVWLMRLGVELERIQPAHPEQNGRHERMHRTLKEDTTRPAAHNSLRQQERFDTFQRVFNEERPHEALDMKTPKSLYRPSERAFPDTLSSLSYPLHDLTRLVSYNGLIRMGQAGQFYIGKAFAAQPIGLRQLEAQTWLVSFMDLDLGYLDLDSRRLLPIQTNQIAA
jgi:transposase InsO family protein